ncbi:hypothetical protein TNIN_367641 [Trichonephila inaurata madagascariensis]|uniref:Uncharacterized protein n=1 Tax=Trichonephila inaurata madagascariensis TaxID=2747483 RepID=A0A8X6WUU0_9ARAC|nr:hypothetical protein TNIN_367641 [Trichonephila inaurata madagascariensis]
MEEPNSLTAFQVDLRKLFAVSPFPQGRVVTCLFVLIGGGRDLCSLKTLCYESISTDICLKVASSLAHRSWSKRPFGVEFPDFGA